MALFDQPKTSYSDTTNAKRIISEAIKLIDPIDVPLLAALGGFDGARDKFNIRENGTKIEWLEDTYAPLSDVAAQGTTITTNTTVLTVTDASIFQDGHVIQIDSEYMVVSSVDVTNNTLTVYSRSYGGTNATHATTSTISIVGMARLEGDDADYVGLQVITNPFNYTGIFQKALKITGTEEVVDEYGYEDAFTYQANKAVPELTRLVELAIFNGIRAIGTATTPRSFGGLPTYITTFNTVAAGGAIAKTHIDSVAEKVRLNGGMPDLFVCHPSIANDVRALLDSSSFVRLTQENQVFGMLSIERMNTQYGGLQIVESLWCPTSTAYVLDSSRIGLYQLRPFQWHPLAKTGDSRKAEVLCELSLVAANDKGHGKITGITT
ncbi:MAG TPA: DUF5309 family protein [Candidatus Paceibacterota bacterium]